MPTLDEIYVNKRPALSRAQDKLRKILENAVLNIEDKGLVRAFVSSIRIKELSSLARKAQKNGREFPEDSLVARSGGALTLCSDLIGGRVVCNNIEDVYRFLELLKEQLPTTWDNFEVQDYINQPNKGGYRALHVNFRLDLGEHPLHPDLVPCEVQIQSLLQHAWAELSHDDIYKQPDIPEDLRARFNDLSEVLAAADKIASQIRTRVMRETTAPEHRPDLGLVSPTSLAFVFREVFGRLPPDYAVRQAINLCDQFRIATLEQLPNILGLPEFREKVANAYRSILDMAIEAEDIFLAAIYAVAKGDNKAIEWIRRNARRERRALEQFATSETLSSLPDTIEELIEDLEDPRGETDDYVKGWADAFGATRNCAVCGTTVIQPYSFAEAAVQHYDDSDIDFDDAHERIEMALRQSGVETGGWGNGSLCADHNEQAAKDD